MAQDSEDSLLETSTTTLSILELIREAQGATMAQLVEATGNAKSSVYAHLQTLRNHHLITKEGERYYVGLRSLSYAEQARNRKPEYDLARNAVDDLVERIGDESGFAVEENGRAVLLYNAANVGDATFKIGEIGPIHATASGKAILASYPQDRIEGILDYHGLSSPSDHAITDREALLEDLAETRERGYSVVDQEFVEGMRSIGVPVEYPDGRVFGALHVSAPAYRGSLSTFRDAVADVIQSAARDLEHAVAENT